MFDFAANQVFIAAVLCLNVALSEWLVQRTFLRHIGTALVVIVLTAVASNIGIIPASSTGIYDAIFEFVAPLAIFLPLLEVNLKGIARAGAPMLASFGVAATGTVIGVPLAAWVVGLKEAVGPLFAPLGGMFVGTYTGGSVNFNALALHYGMTTEGNLYAGSVAADNIMTALWMIATLAVPRLFMKEAIATQDEAAAEGWVQDDTASVHPRDIGILLGAGAAALWLSSLFSSFSASLGYQIPSVLVLTSLALILAQSPATQKLKASRPMGMFCVYLFLAVIGAYCDLSALGQIGSLGLRLFLFVLLAVIVHGMVTFTLGRLVCKDWAILAVASQANIGGATSALALARSLGRRDLLLPSILVGSLGYGVGTYLGFFTAEFLLR